MKIAPAFSTGPLEQFSSHKSVFFFVFVRCLGVTSNSVAMRGRSLKWGRSSSVISVLWARMRGP